ncbi:MAG TPA: glycosyltransferase family 39 protein [Acidimicrobiales bacterium]|nr:glycosyltransferase family 39 protein [Acidimicrobiales bacterium]
MEVAEPSGAAPCLTQWAPTLEAVPTRERATLPVARLALFGSLAAGLVLRFWTRSPLWLDEALTVNVARLPLGQMPRALAHDGAPPLYYVLLHGWMSLTGTGNLAVRSLSGVFAVATLPVSWLAGRRLGGGRVAWVTALLLATSPFAVHYATEARMYALMTLLVFLGYLALVRVWERPGWRAVVPVALVSCLLLYTHYWSIYLLGVVAVGLFWRLRRDGGSDRRRAGWALAGLAVGALTFLPWAPTLMYQLRHTGTPWAVPAKFSAMVNAVSEFAGGKSSPGRGLGLLFFALAGLGLFGRAIDERHVELDLATRPRARAVAYVTAATLGVAITAGLLTRSAFQARYAAVVFAPFLLLVALGTDVLTDRRVLAGVLALAVALGLGGASGNVVKDRTQAGAVATFIRAGARPGDVVGFCPDQLGPSVSRLLPGRLVQVTYPRMASPRIVDWHDYGARNRGADPDAFVRSLLERVPPGNQLWLVWGSGYRTLGQSCDHIHAVVATKRPARDLVVSDSHTFEHMWLTQYLAP